jgi:hypothetical protein
MRSDRQEAACYSYELFYWLILPATFKSQRGDGTSSFRCKDKMEVLEKESGHLEVTKKMGIESHKNKDGTSRKLQNMEYGTSRNLQGKRKWQLHRKRGRDTEVTEKREHRNRTSSQFFHW